MCILISAFISRKYYFNHNISIFRTIFIKLLTISILQQLCKNRQNQIITHFFVIQSRFKQL